MSTHIHCTPSPVMIAENLTLNRKEHLRYCPLGFSASREPRNSASMSLRRKSATASAGRCTIGFTAEVEAGVEHDRDAGAGGEPADQPVIKRFSEAVTDCSRAVPSTWVTAGICARRSARTAAPAA
jgi:hypothetical protein